jgi:hypothetical protein
MMQMLPDNPSTRTPKHIADKENIQNHGLSFAVTLVLPGSFPV